MSSILKKLIKNYKNNYTIPQEHESYILKKQIKHIAIVMGILFLFSICYLLFLKFAPSNQASNAFLKFLFYFLMMGGSLIIGLISLIALKKQKIYLYHVINIFTLFLFAGLTFITTLIPNTDVTNCVFFYFIEMLIGITFCSFDPAIFILTSSVVFVRLFIEFLNRGLGVCAFNCCFSHFVIISLCLYKARTTVDNLKKSSLLKNQNYKLNEQTIELSAQQEELLKLKTKLEDTVILQANEIETKSEKIIHLQEHTIKTLSNLVESRDEDTGMHVFRTSAYVKMLGEEAYKRGLYPETINLDYISKIEFAAPLHDIGKILISDVVLKKPGKLTAEEFEQIKIHTSEGRKIISVVLSEEDDTEYVNLAMDIATYHHEKWDGSGYPNGLKSEEIPISARIMALADVFDALVSKRCYKAPLSVEDAFDVLEKSKGTHFDPLLTDAFLACKAKILSIMETYNENV